MTVELIGCRSCTVVPIEPRQGEHHFAVHFGDVGNVHVYLNGEEVFDCPEVFAGPGGGAFRYSDEVCHCGSGLAMWYFDRDDGYSVRIIAEKSTPTEQPSL